MKTYRRTRDILDMSKRFHGELSELYRTLSDQSDRKRVKLLLDYMSRHERQIEKCLAKYEEQASHRILDCWFQYAAEDFPYDIVQEVRLNPKMTIDEVVDLAVRMDDALTELYRHVADEAESQEVSELFNNLAELEKSEEVAMVRSALGIMNV